MYACTLKMDVNNTSTFSGIFNVGINAIMGPSGCGKTRYMCIFFSGLLHMYLCSLISILSGRKTKGVSGHVVFSGEIIPDNFRYIVGYVPQVSDIMVCDKHSDIVYRMMSYLVC